MCLLITQTKPYNKTGYRYKILELDEKSGEFYSVYYSHKWISKKMNAGYASQYKVCGMEAHRGIHVFNKLKDALIAHAKTYSYGSRNVVLVKVKVSGFLGAGKHIRYAAFANRKTGEVWKEAKIVKILKKRFAYFKRPLVERAEIQVGDWATGRGFNKQSNGRYNAYKICRIEDDLVYFIYCGKEWNKPWSLKSGRIIRVSTKSKKHNFLK